MQGPPGRRDYAEELLRAFPAGQVVNAEGSVVDLPFQLPNGRPTALRVSLPAQFPQDRPVLCVLVPLQHPAVDSTGRVHVRGVEQWGSGPTQRRGPAELVAVVREAFGLLHGDQPGGATARPAAGGNMGATAGTSGAGGGHGGGGGGPGGGGPVGGGGGGGGAADPEGFLESLSTAQLEAMLCDEEALRRAAAEWLQDTPAAHALEEVRRANRSAAAANLSLGRSVDEARGHVAIVRSGEYAAMRALFEELAARQAAVVDKMGPDVILARVQAEVDKADVASDALLERFQSGAMAVEAFVESYVGSREGFHVVDLKRQAAEHHRMVPDGTAWGVLQR